jgi:hypothetical protein
MERFPQLAALSAAALACDVTRVVSIQITGIPTAAFGAPPGDVHQDIAHGASAEPRKTHMTSYNRLHAEMMAQLLGLLSSYPEGSGTLLDNTAVVWFPEHGHRDLRQDSETFGEAHSLLEIPVVIAGGCGGAFQTGRYLSHERSPIELQFGNHALTGPPHNRLLVSLAQAMGLDVDVINQAERTIGGQFVDLSGPLAGLQG